MVMNEQPNEAAAVRAGGLLSRLGDLTEGRVDEDEQILGSYIADGVISAVLDAHLGVVRVTTEIGDEITATILEFYSPIPTVGSEVRIEQGPSRKAYARPTYPTYPQQFVATVVSGQNGPTDGHHTAVAEHSLTEFGTLRVVVIGALGLALEVNDRILCSIASSGDRAVSGTTQPPARIYATSKIGSAS